MGTPPPPNTFFHETYRSFPPTKIKRQNDRALLHQFFHSGKPQNLYSGPLENPGTSYVHEKWQARGKQPLLPRHPRYSRLFSKEGGEWLNGPAQGA